MKSRRLAIASLVVLGFAATLLVFPVLAGQPAPTNIDVSQLSNNESEEAIAVNPTNPNNLVIVTNIVVPAAGMFAAVSLDGGSTWTTRIIADNDNLGAACCDPFYGGIAHPAWSDNSNSTGNNPDGTLGQLDIYTARVPLPQQ